MTLAQGCPAPVASPATSPGPALSHAALAELDFIIIGAMKSGTTTIGEYMHQCANALVFSDHFGLRPDLFGDPGHPHFERHARFDARVAQAIAECRARHGRSRRIGHIKGDYYGKPAAMRQILERTGAKLVLSYRAPAARLFSHYNHMVKQGYTAAPFETWQASAEGGWAVRLSRFGACFESFAAAVDPSRLRVISMEDTSEPAAMARLFDFLDLSLPSEAPQKAHASWMPRNRAVNFALRQSIDGLLPRGSRVNSRVNRIRRRLIASGTRPWRPSAQEAARWEAVFAEDHAAFLARARPFMITS